MRSIFYSLDKEEFADLINQSFSIKNLIEKFGMRDVGGNRKTLFKAIEFFSLQKELNNLRTRQKENNKKQIKSFHKKKSNDEVFTINSNYGRGHLKARILEDNLFPYVCRECKNNGIWNNKKLILQLEHINGNPLDNRLNNLCFLCPNGHSQTKAFAGRKKKNSSKEIEKKKRILLREKVKKQRISFLNQLDLTEYGWIKKVQKEWNVSHTQVKRWIKKNYPELKYFER